MNPSQCEESGRPAKENSCLRQTTPAETSKQPFAGTQVPAWRSHPVRRQELPRLPQIPHVCGRHRHRRRQRRGSSGTQDKLAKVMRDAENCPRGSFKNIMSAADNCHGPKGDALRDRFRPGGWRRSPGEWRGLENRLKGRENVCMRSKSEYYYCDINVCGRHYRCPWNESPANGFQESRRLGSLAEAGRLVFHVEHRPVPLDTSWSPPVAGVSWGAIGRQRACNVPSGTPASPGRRSRAIPGSFSGFFGHCNSGPNHSMFHVEHPGLPPSLEHIGGRDRPKTEVKAKPGRPT